MHQHPEVSEVDTNQKIDGTVQNPDVGELYQQRSQSFYRSRKEPKDRSNWILTKQHMEERRERGKPATI